MPAWSILTTTTPPPAGSEEWITVPIDGDVGHLAYAVRLVVPDNTPLSWNTGGFFGLYQVVEGKLLASRTYPIPLIARGSLQMLRYVGAGDQDLVPGVALTFGIVYFVRRWVEAEAFEIWVLE
jgi:hypothetical protein